MSGRTLKPGCCHGSACTFGPTASLTAARAPHSRHDLEMKRWLAWEIYAQVEADRFRLVALRELTGTGPRFTVLRSDATQL